MKRTVRENFRVVIEIERGRYVRAEPTEKTYEASARAVAEWITKATPLIDPQLPTNTTLGTPYIECDARDECSHCGREWEVEGAGVPVCCDAAIQEYWRATPGHTHDSATERVECETCNPERVGKDVPAAMGRAS